jgi:tetratricopeptide (TPR) repeat protein
MSPSEVSDYWFGKSFAFIRANPAAELKLLGRKFGMFFNAFEVPQIESYALTERRYGSLKILFVNFWFLGAIGLLGLLLSIPQWRRLLPLQGYVFVFALSIVIFFITARYRAQIAPVFALFAAYALLDRLPRVLVDVRRGFGFAGLFLLILFMTQPRLFAWDQNEILYREHVHEARRASMAGEPGFALTEIEKALELYPDYHEGYIHRAIIHKEHNDVFKAIEDYTRAIDLRPGLSGTHYDLAQALRQVNLKQQAIEEYKKALEIDTLMVKAYNNLGITYAELGRFNEAVKNFERVIEIDPTYVKTYNNMGVLLAQNGHADEAIAVFRQAIAHDADYANSYKNLANAYITKKQIHPAIEALTRYLELEPDDDAARVNLQKLYVAASYDSTGAVPEGQ